MEAIAVNLVLPLLEQLLPLFSGGGATSTTVSLVIKGLEVVIPALGSLTTRLMPKIKNIIAAASADPAATKQQLADLRQLDADSDAAFDAALAAAEAEDAKNGIG